MAEPNSVRWIVLIHKSPKGPFSTDELNNLMKQGVVKRNDVACRVEGSQSSTWKLIWQFEEFERRTKSTKVEEGEVEEPEKERRKVTEAEIEKQKSEKLPDEITKIPVETLILNSERTLAPRESEDTEEEIVLPETGEETKRSSPVWIAIGLIVIAIVGIGLTQFAGSPEVKKEVKKTVQKKKVTRKKAPSPLSRIGTRKPSTKDPFEKLRRRQRAAQNLEQEDEEDEYMDDPPPPSRKKSKKKKKKRAKKRVEEEEEFDDEEFDDEFDDGEDGEFEDDYDEGEIDEDFDDEYYD